jgi:prepilin-type N-terminal cleavage/methylation domain-containing protein
MKMLISKNKKQTRGFTLIELLVALGVFGFVSFMAITVLVSIISANSRLKAQRAITDNLSFVMEDMVKTIRFGSNYHCGDTDSATIDKYKSCDFATTAGGTVLALEPLENTTKEPHVSTDQAVYRWREDSAGIGMIEKSPNNSGASWIRLTPDNIDVEMLRFYVENEVQNEKFAKVLISLKAVVAKGTKNETKYNLQTYVAQRSPTI